MNFRQKLAVAGVDMLILAELTVAVYKSAQVPVDDSAAVFLRFFLPAAVATIAIGRLAINKLKTKTS